MPLKEVWICFACRSDCIKEAASLLAGNCSSVVSWQCHCSRVLNNEPQLGNCKAASASDVFHWSELFLANIVSCWSFFALKRRALGVSECRKSHGGF